MKGKKITTYVLNAFLRKVNTLGSENKTDIFTIEELNEVAEEIVATLKVKVKKKRSYGGNEERIEGGNYY